MPKCTTTIVAQVKKRQSNEKKMPSDNLLLVSLFLVLFKVPLSSEIPIYTGEVAFQDDPLINRKRLWSDELLAIGVLEKFRKVRRQMGQD